MSHLFWLCCLLSVTLIKTMSDQYPGYSSIGRRLPNHPPPFVAPEEEAYIPKVVPVPPKQTENENQQKQEENQKNEQSKDKTKEKSQH
ncbi:unnamed protein product [Cylicocyclus nassatus]|uniref:Uncharacterized protein n=1 Tax=Cylicocyclus nassatus TaxID=53992 RepID=A0AA36GPE2_CYLNA|nr:unnamed protein product [Cylicocyclus nassatus]